MRLERADEFSERKMLARQAQTFKARMEAGERCIKCGGKATRMRGDRFLCELDAQIADQLAWRDENKQRNLYCRTGRFHEPSTR